MPPLGSHKDVFHHLDAAIVKGVNAELVFNTSLSNFKDSSVPDDIRTTPGQCETENTTTTSSLLQVSNFTDELKRIGTSENVRSNCTRTKPEVQPLALKKCHGAIYLHEAPSGPAFGNRDADATYFIGFQRMLTDSRGDRQCRCGLMYRCRRGSAMISNLGW